MKKYGAIILVVLALLLLAVPAAATDQTVKTGDYIQFDVYAPGTDTIQFYVIGQNKFFMSDPDLVGTTKYTKKELEEYLKENMYYVYNKEDGNFTIYLRIADDSSAENHFALGDYQLIVQHPNADRIYNTTAVPASGHGYSSGYDIMTNGVFKFNVPACSNMDAASKLVAAIAEGNDMSVTYKFSVVAEDSAGQEIFVVPEETVIPDIPVTIETPAETTETPAPAEPVKTPFPVIGILAGFMGGFALIKRK